QAALQLPVPAKDQVVSVARVVSAGGRGEASQATVEAIRTEIRQRRRGRRSLWQVREAEALTGVPVCRPLWTLRPLLQDVVGNAVGTQPSEQPRDGGGVTGGAEHAMDARGAGRREEVTQVEVQHDRAAAVRGDKAGDGATAAVTVGGIVGRHKIEKAMQELALERSQASLRDFQQASPAIGLRQPAIGIMTAWAGR